MKISTFCNNKTRKISAKIVVSLCLAILGSRHLKTGNLKFVDLKFILANKLEFNVTIHHMEHETIHATE